MAFLDVRNLSVSYGPVTAVKGIDLSVEKGKIIALLGANGAGKSSVVNAISGLVDHTADKWFLLKKKSYHLKQNSESNRADIDSGRKTGFPVFDGQREFIAGWISFQVR